MSRMRPNKQISIKVEDGKAQVIARPALHIILETGSLSGGVRVIGEMANRLVLRGWPVSIWSINQKETLTKWFRLDPRIEWNCFENQRNEDDYEQLAAVLKRQAGYKMATFWKTAFAAAYASAPGEGLYLVQDVEIVYAPGPIMQAKVMETYGLGLRCLTTSRWVEKQLKQSDYIGLGVDTAFFKPQPKVKRSDYALACARRQYFKGWTQLAEVAQYMAMAGHPLHTYGLDRSLHLLAPHVHVPYPADKVLHQLYCETGCFISTSRHEGFSLTPLEAMACGTPVVMSSADGNLEYAQSGVNCILAETPEAIASEALELLVRPDKGQALRQAAIETARRYTWPEVINRVEAILMPEIAPENTLA